MTLPSIKLFTFFTGAGFLDLGFEDAGFDSVFANEISEEFAKVYTYSREKMGRSVPMHGLHKKSIDCFLEKQEDIDFLANAIKIEKNKGHLVGFLGGPPCPDFSVAGKNAGAKGEHGRLSSSYAKLIIENKPDFFVFENVKGLWRTAQHRAFFDSLVKNFHKHGYKTSARLINALEYGAPQDRDRIILIGIREEIITCPNKQKEIEDFPWTKHIKYNLSEIKTIQWPATDKFCESGTLPQPDGIIPELTVEYWFKKNDVCNHPNAKDFFIPRAGLAKMQIYDEGDDSKKCYKRLHRWRYSPTVAYGNNEVHLHPYHARRLSVAEALALQSLPVSFALPPSITLSAKFKTIGNGVPYLAARGVGETLFDFLTNNCTYEM